MFVQKTKWLFTASLAIFFFTAIFVNQTSAQTQPYNYLRIFYYQETNNARESLYSHPGSIDVLAPQTYSFNSTGKLLGSIKPITLAFAQKNNIKVMPLVVNGNFQQKAYKTILNSESKQNIAINALISEAKKNNYWGWQIDFEQMDVSYRDRFSSFIKKASEKFKENKLILSVAVIAQGSNNPTDYPAGCWKNVVGVYDYKTLGESADFVSIMSYDDPKSIGPVTSYPWLRHVLNYSLSQIPASKLSMGMPLYYWVWNDKTGKLVGIGGRDGIYNVFKKYDVITNYDHQLQTASLMYSVKNKQYTLWYENAKSIAKKLELVTQYKLHSFSAWALGLELPEIFKVI